MKKLAFYFMACIAFSASAETYKSILEEQYTNSLIFAREYDEKRAEYEKLLEGSGISKEDRKKYEDEIEWCRRRAAYERLDALKYLPMNLPEDHMSPEEWRKETERHPWKKWVMLEKSPITNDFVNTTSNVLVITILDYEQAARDGIRDRKTIAGKYRLNAILHPGDKYVEMHDGSNGVRLTSYVQIHKICHESREYAGINKFICSKTDRLPPIVRVLGTNITFRINGREIEKFIALSIYETDYDNDGISDEDEIFGKNGFVTDPTNPDTDEDGIPDSDDKFPLESCKSEDDKLMPKEWAEYWSNGDASLLEKLLPSSGDADLDGLNNEIERTIHTDPTVKNTEPLILYPKKGRLHKSAFNSYSGDFYVIVNTNIMVEATIGTGYYDEDTDSITHRKSHSLNGSDSWFTSLYSENSRYCKRNYKDVILRPMTMHEMRFTTRSDKLIPSQTINVTLRTTNYFREDRGFSRSYVEMNYIPEEKHTPEQWPEQPSMIFPKPDQLFFEKFGNKAEFAGKRQEWFWHYQPYMIRIRSQNPFITNYYHISDLNSAIRYGSTAHGSSNMNKYNFSLAGDFYALGLGIRLRHVYGHQVQSELIPAFKTKRLNLDSEFAFKPDTLRNIRLQAKYGKKRYYDETRGEM